MASAWPVCSKSHAARTAASARRIQRERRRAETEPLGDQVGRQSAHEAVFGGRPGSSHRCTLPSKRSANAAIPRDGNDRLPTTTPVRALSPWLPMPSRCATCKPSKDRIEALEQRGWDLKSRASNRSSKPRTYHRESTRYDPRLPNSTDGVTRGDTPTVGRHVRSQITRFENGLKERIGSRAPGSSSTADNGDGRERHCTTPVEGPLRLRAARTLPSRLKVISAVTLSPT